jgi:hypothetical protein
LGTSRTRQRDSKVDNQAAELVELRERMAKLEANSGNSILREVDERKIRECNIVIHQLPELQGSTAQEKREGDELKVQGLLDVLTVKLTVKQDVKFSRRQGKPSEGQDVIRPLLVGFKLQQDQEYVLANCWRLARNNQYSKVSVGRDLTAGERKKERDLMVEAKAKNLNRSLDEQSKKLVYKIVGERGRRREILVPLRPWEVLDQDGRVWRQSTGWGWEDKLGQIQPEKQSKSGTSGSEECGEQGFGRQGRRQQVTQSIRLGDAAREADGAAASQGSRGGREQGQRAAASQECGGGAPDRVGMGGGGGEEGVKEQERRQEHVSQPNISEENQDNNSQGLGRQGDRRRAAVRNSERDF